MGDKTQLLALVLATRFKKPWVIMAGIFCATVLNHLMAAFGGVWLTTLISAQHLNWIIGSVFIGFAIWLLIPDKDEELNKSHSSNAFLTTLVAFFIAEMGDKTQLSTVALAAKYQSFYWVTLGTTLGMMFSDGLAVLFGEKISQSLSMNWIRRFAALLFLVFGIATIFGF